MSPGPDARVAGPDGTGAVDGGEDAFFTCSAPSVGTGTGLNAEYFGNPDFTGTLVSRIDGTIDWDFGQGGPDSRIGTDNFSARWTGKVQAEVSGPHTFLASYNDGMRVFLDDRVVLYRWGPHITTAEESGKVMLEGGRRYDLRVEFFDQGGAAIARLAWVTPCQTRAPVPRKDLYPLAAVAPTCLVEAAAGSGTGLKVEYFSGNDPSQGQPVVQGVSPRIDFDWGTGSPAAGVPSDFSTRWTGTLEAPVDGALTIYLATDDVGRLRLAGTLLMDSWAEPFGPQEIAATIDVRRGQRYALVIEHRDDVGTAFAHLYWSWPCHPREVVPTARLYPAP
jgi:hypothetical protein